MKEIKSFTLEGEDFSRLLMPGKKGILRLLFSRFFLFAILMIVQIGLFLWFLYYAAEHFEHYLIVERIFAFMMIIYLFSCSMDSSAKLTWMLIFSIAPVVGAGLLAYTKINLGNRRVTRETAKQIQETRSTIIQPDGVLRELGADGSHTDDLVRYLNRSGCFPAYNDSETEYYPIGEEMFSSMIRELRKAERAVHTYCGLLPQAQSCRNTGKTVFTDKTISFISLQLQRSP